MTAPAARAARDRAGELNARADALEFSYGYLDRSHEVDALIDEANAEQRYALRIDLEHRAARDYVTALTRTLSQRWLGYDAKERARDEAVARNALQFAAEARITMSILRPTDHVVIP